MAEGILSDRSLRFAGTDDPAEIEKFGEVYTAAYHLVLRYMYGFVGDNTVAEDLAQKTFIHAFEKRTQFAGGAGIMTWLHRIAQNVFFDQRRRDKARRENRTQSLEQFFAENPNDDQIREIPWGSSAEVSPEKLVIQQEYALALLSRVREEDRNLVVLKDIEGHSIEELAAITGLNENTLKVKIFRARERMRKAVRNLSRRSRITEVQIQHRGEHARCGGLSVVAKTQNHFGGRDEDPGAISIKQFHALGQIVKTLSVEQRELFGLRYFRGLLPFDMAEALEMKNEEVVARLTVIRAAIGMEDRDIKMILVSAAEYGLGEKDFQTHMPGKSAKAKSVVDPRGLPVSQLSQGSVHGRASMPDRPRAGSVVQAGAIVTLCGSGG